VRTKLALFTRLYRDARSTKHKVVDYCLSYFSFRGISDMIYERWNIVQALLYVMGGARYSGGRDGGVRRLCRPDAPQYDAELFNYNDWVWTNRFFSSHFIYIPCCSVCKTDVIA